MNETYSYEVKRYFCRKCHSQWASKQTADKCCEKSLISFCTRCSAKIDDTYFEHRAICDACREFDRVKKAQIVEKCPSEGFLFVEPDCFLDCSEWEEALIERINEGDICEDDLKGYLYLTHQEWVELGIDEFLDRMYDSNSRIEPEALYGVKDLQEAIDVFNEKNKEVGSWFPDFSRIFVYDQKLFDQYLLSNSIYISPLDRALGVTRKMVLENSGLGGRVYE